LNAAAVQAIAAHLTETLEGHVAAWNAQDADAVRAFWDGGTIHEDTGFGVEVSGEELFSMPEGFFRDFAPFRWEIAEVFVAANVGLAVTRMYLPGDNPTENEPLIEVDRIEVDDAGIMGRWTLFYGLETYELWNAADFRMDAAYSLLDAYTAAWQSGDPAQVAALYAPDAERDDSLFGLRQSSPQGIAAFAAEFFGWYPDVALNPGVGFSDTRTSAGNPERVGSVYELQVRGAQGEPCTVRTAVILTAADGLIVHEEVFWDAASLLACGLAA
jgi:ketosteroid isomerase-like protein